ncbi:MAG: hypothetical protein QM645_11865 [Asticcacaulis sp.]
MSSDFTRPFFLWWNVAERTGRMMVDSAEVIEHRLGQMAEAKSSPAEMMLMGQEKVEAAAESLTGMGLYWMDIQRRLGQQTVKVALEISHDSLSLAMSRTPAEFFSNQMSLNQSLFKGVQQASKLSGETANLTRRGMKPVHKRATANVKRLRGSKKTGQS